MCQSFVAIPVDNRVELAMFVVSRGLYAEGWTIKHVSSHPISQARAWTAAVLYTAPLSSVMFSGSAADRR